MKNTLLCETKKKKRAFFTLKMKEKKLFCVWNEEIEAICVQRESFFTSDCYFCNINKRKMSTQKKIKKKYVKTKKKEKKCRKKRKNVEKKQKKCQNKRAKSSKQKKIADIFVSHLRGEYFQFKIEFNTRDKTISNGSTTKSATKSK